MGERGVRVNEIMEFTSEVHDALSGLVFGEEIGRGAFRIVYDYPLDDSLVIKGAFCHRGIASNFKEKAIWEEVSMREDIAKWLAPVMGMSHNGRYLIMKKARMSEDTSEFPKKVPHFFTDLKYQNYGFIGKQLVCVDYGSFVATNGMTQRMVNGDWWGAEMF